MNSILKLESLLKGQHPWSNARVAESVTVLIGFPLGLALPIIMCFGLLHPAYSAFRVGALLFGNACVAPLVCGALLVLRTACVSKSVRSGFLVLSCFNAGLFAFTVVSIFAPAGAEISPSPSVRLRQIPRAMSISQSGSLRRRVADTIIVGRRI